MSGRCLSGAELLKALQGRWKTVYTEIDGQYGPREDSHYLTYSGNKFSVEKDGKVAHEGTFTLNASHQPAEIVYIYSKSFPIYLGGPRAGRIQLEGETLKCCFSPLGQASPTSFDTYANSERVLTVHQRWSGDRIAPSITQSATAFSAMW